MRNKYETLNETKMKCVSKCQGFFGFIQEKKRRKTRKTWDRTGIWNLARNLLYNRI